MFDLLPDGTLPAYGLYLMRTSALVLAAPLLGMGTGVSSYKVALTVAVAVVLYLATGDPMPGVGPGEYVLLAMRELLVGLFLAFVVHIAVLGVHVAGTLIGHEMGFMMSNVLDPVTGISTPLIVKLYEGFFFLGLLAVDGHHWLLRALGASFEHAPVGFLDFNQSASGVLVDMFGQMFAAGLTLAAPVMVLLAIVSMVMGIFARVVPQLNVLEVGFTLRVAAALFAMFLFSPLLSPALSRMFGMLSDGLEAGLTVIGG